ncbi:NADH-dependent [FeFe] hydrogenase, group A6 [Ruminococcus flavefaciens]|uniref:NAD(P)-dependent iron-only hydrogenase catalytic subunit n=1 Tax=Ruminococcus flavefaciens TaxID=1265 RepID=A0A1K1NDA2_RUMFL|nr:NADH-dependent [FeFe] hydrogenase, group A6 [Ruminococcus flavefaciens]SFW33426.1 NAD(P)-dependent iron-only hydrogenase catalytic subunit [Ruminococcus flavefaciens]
MENITVKINGVELEVPKGTTVLEAAHMAGFEIPTLCYMKEINEIGACRICVTEVNEGRGFRLVAGCVYPCSNNMEILTNSPKVIESRKRTLELILSTHDRKCLSCVRSGNCELQKLAKDYGVEDATVYDGVKNEYEVDNSAPHMYRDNNKCILCRRCVAVCAKTQGIGVIGANERGFKTYIGSAFDMGLGETSCVSCGQCIAVCPVGALSEKDYTKEVMAAIADPEKTVLVQTAPAVRAGLGECFGNPIGTNAEGKMVAALRRLGFDKVFDTDFAADLTIMEEANEFLDRFKNGGTLPLITSCSPGWVKFCEHYYPDLLDHLSTCKSPQQMFGATAKTYYAQKMGIDPKNIVMVSIMPCTAKKFEIGRPDQSAAGVPDVDYALTTRELGRMIERAGILFNSLPEEKFDDPLGISTGAGVIFGATGGVMEAALRTAVYTLTGDNVTDLPEVRGTKDIKEATYNVAGTDVNVIVTSGLANARKVLDSIRDGSCKAQFIEIMACPGGCVNGGGQPQVPMGVRNFVDIREERAKVLYNLDKSMPLRQSHENPAIKKVYEEFFEKPGSHKAHEVLHTSYIKRKVNEI